MSVRARIIPIVSPSTEQLEIYGYPLFATECHFALASFPTS
jgi:hypothetical protein